MVKRARSATPVWWRGYQAVLRADGDAAQGEVVTGRIEVIPGAGRRPARVAEHAEDPVRPRILPDIPRRRLEELAWRHAHASERGLVGKTRLLQARLGDDQEPRLVAIDELSDAQLMMKIPLDRLARLARLDKKVRASCG